MIKLLIALLIVFTSCNLNKQLSTMANNQAPLVIYKTKADYSNNVPVVMDSSKTKIISYPSMRDVLYNGKVVSPISLKENYLLDNLGVNTNSVYTSYTLKEYSELSVVPTLDVLMKSIIDDDPFLEMFSCGKRNNFTNVKDVNVLIDDLKLNVNCIKIK
ncbi:MAG: hypothetical protein KAG96_01820 [Ichthyobacteriaceae bacterium]|nr:hypothetical protein [Ichthyobacteriaceae bacterium]